MTTLWKMAFCAALLATTFVASAMDPNWKRIVAMPCDDAGGDALEVPLADETLHRRLDAFSQQQTPPLRDGEKIFTCDSTQCATYALARSRWRTEGAPIARRAGDECALTFNGRRVISITTIE